MSLFKRGNVWWAYVWIDGVRHHKTTGTSNRRQAETIERQFHDELNQARHRLPQLKPEMTVGALSALFIGSDMARPHALDRLKHLLPFFSELPIVELNRAAIRRYRQERQKPKTVNQKGKEKQLIVKSATVNRDLSVLRRILYWGIEEGYLAVNPLARIRMERERRTKRPVLSLREEQLLMASAPEHLQRIILCALHTGMRRGEILSQRWEDIDFDNRILHVSHSKTPEGEMREIPLAQALYEMLFRHRKQHGIVFTFEGESIKIIKTSWGASLRRSGIRHFRFHDLRHTVNTRMMLARVLQEVRREILGHTSQRSRDVNDGYVQIELPEKREAIRQLEVWMDQQKQDQQKFLLEKELGATTATGSSTSPRTTPEKEEPEYDGND